SCKVKRFLVPKKEQHFGVIFTYDDGTSLRIYCRGKSIHYWDQSAGKTREHRRLGVDFRAPLEAGENAPWTVLTVLTEGPYVQVDVGGRRIGTIRRETASLRSAKFYAYRVDCGFDDIQFARVMPDAKPANQAEAPELALYAAFDGTTAIQGSVGKREARAATGLSFVAGVRGQAVRVHAADGTKPLLDYAAGDAFKGTGGTVMFWFRPEWDGAIQDQKNFPWYGLFAARSEDGETPLRIWQWHWLRADLSRGEEAKSFSLYNRCRGGWLKGDWRHVALVWNEDGWCKMYTDGVPYERGLTGDRYLPQRQQAVLDAVTTFSIGSRSGNPRGMRIADGAFDELRIYRTPLSADQVTAEYRKALPIDLIVERRFVKAGEEGALTLALYPGGRMVIPAVGQEVAPPIAVTVQARLLAAAGGETLAEQKFSGKVTGETLVSLRVPPLSAGDYRLTCTVSHGQATVQRSFPITVYALSPGASPSLDELDLGKASQILSCADPASNTTVLSNVPTTLGTLAGVAYREAGSAKADRFAFEMVFPEEQLHGPPVLLEIAWPDNKPRSTGLYMYPEAKSKQHRDRLEGGIQSGDEYPLSGTMRATRYLFYPDRKRYLFEARTMVPGMPAAVATVTVYPLRAPLPHLAVATPKTIPHRMLGHLDEDQSFEMLFRSNSQPAKVVRHLETLCDYLDYTGQELVSYPLLRYHAIHYPVAGPYPGGNLRPEGWIDLFLQVFRARGKQLIGTVNLYTLPELDLLPSRIDALIDAGMFTRNAQGDLVSGWGGYVPNPAHPEVRSAFLKHVGEVLRRYGPNPAFGGIDIWLNPTWAFKSLEHGYDDVAVAQFAAETGVVVPGGKGRERFPARHAFLTGPALDSWLAWRAKKTTETVAAITRQATAIRPGLRVFLPLPVSPADTTDPAAHYYRNLGMDVAALGKLPNLVLVARRNPAAYRHQKHWDTAETRHDEALFDRANTAVFQAPGQAASASYLTYFESFNDSLKPDPYSGYFQNADVKAHGRFFLREFAYCLATMDTTRMLIGAQPLGTAGRDKVTREFARAYCALPAVPFQDVAGAGDPATVRWGDTKEGPYVYAVNTLCFPVAVTCRFSRDAQGIELGTGMATQTEGKALVIELAPFQLRSFRFPPQSQTRPTRMETRIPAETVAWFAERVATVETGLKAVADTGTDVAALSQHLTALRKACASGAYAEAHRLLFAKAIMELGKLREAAAQGYLKEQAQMLARSAYAVNCGQGGGTFYRGKKGTLFFPDQPFKAGGYGYVGSYKSVTRSVAGLVGTTDPTLFATEAYDFSRYRFTVKPGTYTVRLHLKVGYEPGAKPDVFVFNLDIEGKRVLDKADLFLLGGSDFKKAVMRGFPGIAVTDGVLDLDFGAVAGHSSTARLCNAIEIIPAK
ncbi:MAG: hypothetical protein HN380_19600, partial [Victivallales bacterium]|nr:hypothetical protein [Victivallales bacterium]